MSDPETPCTCITAHDRAVCIGWCKPRPARAGRPVTTGANATRKIHFSVTAAQRAELEAEAARLGLSSADLAAKRRAFPPTQPKGPSK